MRKTEIVSMILAEVYFETLKTMEIFNVSESIFCQFSDLHMKNSFHGYPLAFSKCFFGLDYLRRPERAKSTNQNNSSLFWDKNVCFNKGFFLNLKISDFCFLRLDLCQKRILESTIKKNAKIK